MKSPLHTCLAYVFPLLAASCATTSTPQAAPATKAFEPLATRFTATAPTVVNGEWKGSYVGTVDVYIADEELWQKDSPISLFIQPDGGVEGGLGLRLLGHVMLTAGRRSFYIGEIDRPSGNTIAGEYLDSGILTTTKYIYTLNRNAGLVTGTVKTLVRQSFEETFQPADEWRFNAKRLTGFDPR